ncbi:MAG: hypothetical protein H6502_04145 [Candidatus Woesearchaeota archaeon]|nr:MAG: hypothetical protein H6502_04145 [Candidatus Woesearchaeota archaeon]
MMIVDSITFKKTLSLPSGEELRDMVLLTVRDKNGEVFSVYSPAPSVSRVERVLSWELDCLEREVAVDQRFLSLAKKNRASPFVFNLFDVDEWGSISFKPGTIRVLPTPVDILSYPKLYGDTEFAYFDTTTLPAYKGEFKTWFDVQVAPRLRTLRPSLEDLPNEHVYTWTTKQIREKKGHLCHAGFIVGKHDDGSYHGLLGTTDPSLEERLISFDLGGESFRFAVSTFRASPSATTRQQEKLQKELDNLKRRKLSPSEFEKARARIFERYGVVSTDASVQREQIETTISSMHLRDWAERVHIDAAPLFTIFQNHGFDYEVFKHVETMLAGERSFQDAHGRRPKKSSVKQKGAKENERREFMIKERFANTIVLDPMFLMTNCAPQCSRKNLAAIASFLGVPFEKGLTYDQFTYYSLLADLGDRDAAFMRAAYAAKDVAALVLIMRKLYDPTGVSLLPGSPIKSLLHLAMHTRLPLRSLTLRRSSLDEVAERDFYQLHKRHRINDLAFLPPEELRKKKDELRRTYCRIPSMRAPPAGKRHEAYVAWPLFLKQWIGGTAPSLRKVISLFEASQQGNGDDPVTYARYLEPFAQHLLLGVSYVESLNADYDRNHQYIGVSRDDLRPLHEDFFSHTERKLYNRIRNRFTKYYAALTAVAKDFEQEAKGNSDHAEKKLLGSIDRIVLEDEKESLFPKTYGLPILARPSIVVGELTDHQVMAAARKKYLAALDRCENDMPPEFVSSLHHLGVSVEDFLYLHFQRRKLVRNSQAFYWKAHDTSSAIENALQEGYRRLTTALFAAGFGVVTQRNDILELVSLRDDASLAALKEIPELVYLAKRPVEEENVLDQSTLVLEA